MSSQTRIATPDLILEGREMTHNRIVLSSGNC